MAGCPLTESASSGRPQPFTELGAATPAVAVIVVLATSTAAAVEAAVFGVFDMPIVPNVRLVIAAYRISWTLLAA